MDLLTPPEVSKAASNAAPSVKNRRTRTGCLCCRLRKKKCDERQPKCGACERNFLICTWQSKKSEVEQPRGRRCLDKRPDSALNSIRDELGEFNDQYTTSSYGDDPLSTGDTRHVIRTSTAQESVAKSNALTIVPSPRSIDVERATPTQQLLHQYFLQKTANSVSAQQDRENPFITVLMPIAASSDIVQQTVMALSGAHLRNRTDAPADAALWASTYETLAIRGLKFGLTRYVDNQANALPLLASTLLLCMMETFKGDTNANVFHHLKAARTFLFQWLSTPAAKHEEGIRTFMIELYLYFAILLYIPLGPDSESSIFHDSEVLFQQLGDKRRLSPLLGCSHELFALIPQVFDLARKRQASLNNSDGQLFASQTAEFASLFEKIMMWCPPAGVNADFLYCGIIYQQALLVFLITSFRDPDANPSDDDPIVDRAFNILGAALDKLPYDAPTATTLTWPLAIFGSSSNVPEHRDLIRKRLSGLHSRLEIPCFGQLLRVLEALWKSPDPVNGMESFKIVMKQLKMFVLIT